MRKVENQEDTVITNRIKNDPTIKELKIELYGAEEKDKAAIREKIAAREAEIKGDIKSPSTTQPIKTDNNSGRFPVGTVSNPLPLPPNKEDMKKGKVYATKRGPATWNGSDFEQ